MKKTKAVSMEVFPKIKNINVDNGPPGPTSTHLICIVLNIPIIKGESTLREEIFTGRKFREFRKFWPNSRK